MRPLRFGRGKGRRENFVFLPASCLIILNTMNVIGCDKVSIGTSLMSSVVETSHKIIISVHQFRHLDRASTGKRREVYRPLGHVWFGISLAMYFHRYLELFYIHVILDWRSLIAHFIRSVEMEVLVYFAIILDFKIIAIILFLVRLLHLLRSVEARLPSYWATVCLKDK